MSRRDVHTAVGDTRFPRVSGDEPGFISGAIGYFKFSPRERG